MGTDFLDRPGPEEFSARDFELVKSAVLDPQNYGSHLAAWLKAESDAIRIAQAQFEMFKVPIVFEQLQTNVGMQLASTFVVPGLGENSPHIRIGDIIHLRPLSFDHYGAPLRYVHSYSHGSFFSPDMYMPGWNGDLFHCEVLAVDKRSEKLSIRMVISYDVYQLVQTYVTGGIFNVQFPPRQEARASLRTAVETTSKMLRAKSSTLRTGPDASAGTSVGQTSWVQQMLLPAPDFGQMQTKLNSIHFRFKPKDEQLNHEQLRAVESIVTQEYGTIPYLIHGPPGTGKTKTLVEAALQLLATGTAKHILICAPSDPAADTLAIRLKSSLDPSAMLRLNPPSRTFAEVPMELLPYCCINGVAFDLPPFRRMMQYKVVVTSCRDADVLVKAELANRSLMKLEKELLSSLRNDVLPLPDPHWQALLIDEAAQAAEPEALIPLTVVAVIASAKPPVFVMAGDQKQLGPRTASREAHIRTSLFERLLERPLYSEHPLARHKLKSGVSAASSLTKAMLPIVRPPFSNLIRNYRSHPAILAVPNALFYHETLLPEAAETNSLLSWDGWTGPWPALFGHHDGKDEIETDGGGWYNLSEIKEAQAAVFSLLRSKLATQNEICIMSPFSAQVRRLRQHFRSVGLHDVNIGPMEAFQGLESRVVILCTTRSRTRFLDQDRTRDFGIIHEPRRFNVAITRAKHGLIVLGNREVLSVDPYWRAFLDFCARNGLMSGQIPDEMLENAQAAPFTSLERMLKQSASRPEPPILGLTGELDDPMWMQSAADTSGDDASASDEEYGEGYGEEHCAENGSQQYAGDGGQDVETVDQSKLEDNGGASSHYGAIGEPLVTRLKVSK